MKNPTFAVWLESLDDVAKRMIKDPIGSQQPEQIAKVVPIKPFDFDEQWHIIVTTTKNTKGLAGGRILLALHPDDTRDFDGGVAWMTEESGIRSLIHVWFYEDWIGNEIVLQAIADIAHKMNVHNMGSASHLLSPMERKFGARYGFQVDAAN